jgi:HEAT repeat protein/beta-lactamase regulating signal transducer with metallopeptidase domain
MALVAGTILKGTVLLIATLAVARLLRGSSAATRHLAWTAGVVGLLAMPFIMTLLPWHIPVLPRVEMPAPASSIADTRVTVDPVNQAADRTLTTDFDAPREVAAQVPAQAATPSEPVITAPASAPVARDRWYALPNARTLVAVIPLLWALGALAILARFALGAFALARRTRRARPAAGPVWALAIGDATRRLELERTVPVLLSDDVAMPLVAGILRPRVVLPSDADAWSEERRRAVLYHELAHVRRGDLVPHFVAWLACALWWFHPLVWVAARRLRAESERACDDLVLALGTRASDYAQHLLQIVSAVRVAHGVPAAVLPFARRSEFEGRVIAILEPGMRRGGISRLGGAAVLAAIVLLAVPLAAIVPVPPLDPDAAERLVTGPDPSVGHDGAAAIRSAYRAAAQDESADYDKDVDHDEDVVVDLDGLIITATKSVSASASANAIASASASIGDTGRASATVIAGLARALADADAGTREKAATALGELEDPRAVAALSRALRQDADARVRKAAAWALGEIEDPAGVPALSAALREDRDAGVRQMAVWALGEIEDPSAVPALAVALRDQDVEMRRKAAYALGEIEDPGAVSALSTALREDRDAEVRHNAVWALGEIEDPSAVPALTVALRDQDVEMRRKAAWALGEIESPSAIEGLAAAVRDGDLEVRKTAVWALGEIEDPAGVPALATALRDADPEVRKTAAWALAEIDTPAAYDALVPLLESDDPELRRLAVEAIAHQ